MVFPKEVLIHIESSVKSHFRLQSLKFFLSC